ncbi:MAG: hypothetical protein AB1896_19415, partial [Thermodesulfobacteriota bacterium]
MSLLRHIRSIAVLMALWLLAAAPALGQETGTPPAADNGSTDGTLIFQGEPGQKWVIAVRDFLPLETGGGAPEDVGLGLPKMLRDNLELTGFFL